MVLFPSPPLLPGSLLEVCNRPPEGPSDPNLSPSFAQYISHVIFFLFLRGHFSVMLVTLALVTPCSIPSRWLEFGEKESELNKER